MAIGVRRFYYEFGEKAAYVTVNGVRYAIPRADAWSDQTRSGNAAAPWGKSMSIPLRDEMKGSGKFCGVKTARLALNPDRPTYHTAVRRATYYPADHVTFTAVSRKKPRAGGSAHGKTGRVGRGKVGVGGMRTKSHS
ncbi:hypothetical protein OKW43_007453 [Paraburkholderia sp. WC7.3g]|uniref:Uncharacterized protein n=1 Tax=Paraburkholderia podalyriae TaxID=1938811 RepID=A0ABR7PY74_9BURK|nr:hypothetical protein [Paraburkholderia podalyriae]MBC8751213.1 hypothetical protein [Paraburkholderia podalyriae]